MPISPSTRKFFRRKLEVAGITPRGRAAPQPGRRAQIVVRHGDAHGHHRLSPRPADRQHADAHDRAIAISSASSRAARHRFGKKVIISGVPRQRSSNDLISSADAADPIVEPDWTPAPSLDSTANYRRPLPEEAVSTTDGLPPLDSSLAAEISAVDSTELSEIERRLIFLIDHLIATDRISRFSLSKPMRSRRTINLTLVRCKWISFDPVQGARHPCATKCARWMVARCVSCILCAITRLSKMF